MDLRNILDAIIEVGKEDQAKREITRLEKQNNDLQNECGSCKYWMTKSCEREKDHKVSCAERICKKFSMDSFSFGLLFKNNSKIQDLKINFKTNQQSNPCQCALIDSIVLVDIKTTKIKRYESKSNLRNNNRSCI